MILKYFAKLAQKQLIERTQLEKLIAEAIREYSIEAVKIVKPIEQYSLGEEVTVYISSRNGVLEYIVQEPEYDDDTIYAVSKIYVHNPYCQDIICVEKTVVKSGDRELRRIFSEQPLNVFYHYRKIASGYGPIYPLILDPGIEEIAGSMDDEYISIIHRKYGWFGWMKTNIRVGSEGVDRLVLSLARKIGKHLSISYPIAEGLTEDGLRISY